MHQKTSQFQNIYRLNSISNSIFRIFISYKIENILLVISWSISHTQRPIKWQEWRGSNPQPPVLETGALPIELHSYNSDSKNIKERQSASLITHLLYDRRYNSSTNRTTTFSNSKTQTFIHCNWRY